MKIDQFKIDYPPLICTDFGEAEFAVIRQLCPGLSSPKLGRILNAAGRYMEDKEIYLEIGTFTGYTLIAAAHQNSAHEFWGIDNFRLLGDNSTEKQKEWVKDRLRTNLSHFRFGNQRFVESDFRNVTLPPDIKIGVFLIDGHHTQQEVIENFAWVHGKLADNALIVIDDISAWGVGEGVIEWVSGHPEYQEFFRMNVYHPDNYKDHWSPAFWNGLSLVSFKRNKEAA